MSAAVNQTSRPSGVQARARPCVGATASRAADDGAFAIDDGQPLRAAANTLLFQHCDQGAIGRHPDAWTSHCPGSYMSVSRRGYSTHARPSFATDDGERSVGRPVRIEHLVEQFARTGAANRHAREDVVLHDHRQVAGARYRSQERPGQRQCALIPPVSRRVDEHLERSSRPRTRC